eukprot:TRINITY_DN7795_c0_g1_i1.p1 TRINITY_DN7795_c0_g1~~TRINITY_DN7795_c0_g1_i1.p1  ORF type:complete len:162 (-),score=28.15 TRINITY_DN7795_c0_g1_i1:216-701(-)
MEEKLAEYRRRKEAEARTSNSVSLFQSLSSFFESYSQERPIERNDNQGSRKNDGVQETEEDEDFIPLNDIDPEWTIIDFVIIGLKLALWGALWRLASQYEFGLCYVILSGFVFIYFNLSDRKKRPKEKSAYSVFNRDCRSLDGALTAEHFEKVIGKGGKAS